jgi:Sulfotransferase domain
MEPLRLIRGTPQNPTFDAARLERLIDTFELRPSDVFVCAYMRSGTSLTQQIVHLLRHGGRQDGLSYRQSLPWLEATCSPVLGPIEAPGHTSESLATVPAGTPRFFKTHASPGDLPGSQGGRHIPCKVLYVARNPKDVAVSQYHHLRDKPAYRWRMPFGEFLELFLNGRVPNGSWFDHVLAWWERCSQDPSRMLFLKYEDMVADRAAAVRTAAAFLNIPADEGVVRAVVEGTGLEAMKTNPLTRMGFGHFRKGSCGQWREYFSPEQNEAFDELYRRRMRTSGLVFSFGEGCLM